jgi:ornithine carbamoyltransferase
MSDLQLTNNKSLKDTTSVLGLYLDGLIVRNYDMSRYGKGRDELLQIANYSNIPVINTLDDKDHPCQAMADVLTLKEKFGDDFKNKKIVASWVYADRKKSPGAYFMNCMPHIWGQQASAEVVDGPSSIKLDQAENRLHAQKAILSMILGRA